MLAPAEAANLGAQVGLHDARALVLAYAPRFGAGFAVFLLSLLLARIASSYGQRLSKRLFKDDPQATALVSISLKLITVGLGLFVALEVAGLEAMLMKLIAGAGVLGIVIGFAVKDIAANGLAGFLLNTQRPFKLGDWVDLGGQFGKVTQMGPITTKIRSVYGQDIYVPNQRIYNSSFVNYSAFGKRLVALQVGVSYGDDLAKVKAAALDEMSQIEARVQDTDIDFFFTEIGSSTYNFEVRMWIHFEEQREYLKAKSEMVMRIKTRFEREDFSIAYNVVTLDFAVRGGKNLFDEPLKIQSLR